MTKLIGEQKIVRELPLEIAGKPLTVTLTTKGLVYRLKGHKTPLTTVEHLGLLAQGGTNVIGS